MDPKDFRDQRVREAKTALILDAAQKVFAEKGYHETRLEDIAAAAGFSKASLYNYYEDKESIFLTIMIRMHEKIIESLRSEIQNERHIHENLKAILTTVFRLFKENFSFSISMSDLKGMGPHGMNKFQQHHEDLLARFKLHNQEMVSMVASIFAFARSRNEIKTEIDDATLSRYISALVRETFIEWKVTAKITDIESSINSLLSFIESGLAIG
jgi:AcrR family transcriptional regulator